MERFVCIHGHFYQPPRENPWLEEIEIQDSAYPHHDWNARITAECYSPNRASRILDAEGRIERIVNNYARISFNVGPTLLAWMERHAGDTFQAIREADEESRRRFSGHGSAMAQAYNHMILPLASRRDKGTQIRWGVRDFERRFGRRPEGFWLPETAVDLESLDLAAAEGIRFAVLAPTQAARIRPRGSAEWEETGGGTIDPTRAYLQALPSGKHIALFFYDGPISRAVAFERLLSRGEDLAHRLIGGFSDARQHPQLVHIATDGESYGHHHPHGDMALAYALDTIERSGAARLTNYGEFLERHPPTHEVEILERTSWSCVHGVERWRSNCGCNSGGHPGWHQEWRGPLREALDWLRDELAPRFEARGGKLLRDPWRARDEYIDVILDRSPESMAAFLRAQARGELGPEDTVLALQLLEMQRHAMLMYTSCGWFFDELSGLESMQVIQYAARAVQLAALIFGDHLEDTFLDRLARARSNLPEQGDGRMLFENQVRPTQLDLDRVGAHYSVVSLLEPSRAGSRIYCYEIDREEEEASESGRLKMKLGRATVTSTITRASARLSYAALLLSDQTVVAAVRRYRGAEPFQNVARQVTEAFSRVDIPEVIRLLDRHFGGGTYSLRSLFRDEQRRCVQLLLADALEDAASDHARIYERNAPVLHRLVELGIPIPAAFRAAAERTLNGRLLELLSDVKPLESRGIEKILGEARLLEVPLDHPLLAFRLEETLSLMARGILADPFDPVRLAALESAAELLPGLPFEVDLWDPQNAYHRLQDSVLPETRARMGEDPAAARWVERFVALGRKLGMKVD